MSGGTGGSRIVPPVNPQHGRSKLRASTWCRNVRVYRRPIRIPCTSRRTCSGARVNFNFVLRAPAVAIVVSVSRRALRIVLFGVGRTALPSTIFRRRSEQAFDGNINT